MYCVGASCIGRSASPLTSFFLYKASGRTQNTVHVRLFALCQCAKLQKEPNIRGKKYTQKVEKG